MDEYAIAEESQADTSWKLRTLLIGGVIGALTGLGAAYLLTRRAEQKGETLTMTSGQGLKIGMLVAGLLRSIVTLGED
ncbi:MAG: hypothetical protein FJZ96_14965 [Chloroflexi bacterium]|nr:hypothetical protein [Chloroflexota bacterium]